MDSTRNNNILTPEAATTLKRLLQGYPIAQIRISPKGNSDRINELISVLFATAEEQRLSVYESMTKDWEDRDALSAEILTVNKITDLSLELDILWHDAAWALRPLEPVEWVIENLIPAGTVTVLYGDGGSKKTYAALDMAICVALGKPWLDYQTVQGAVFFIDEELGERFLRPRIQQALRGHLADETTPIYYTCYAGFDFRDDRYLQELHRAILGSMASLVIIDALMDVVPGAKENSVEELLPPLREIRKIAEGTGAAIVIIHHANKNGGYRGTSAIKGAVDLLLRVQSEERSEIIKFETEKTRMIKGVGFTARATWYEGEFYLKPATHMDSPPGTNYAQLQICEKIAELGGEARTGDITQGDKAKEAALIRAREAGLVDRFARGQYRLSPNGKELLERMDYEAG
ncbi:MAG: AAA family ATPase [Anaerolineales bacterium]|nr:AAA family ATPase [Anaerolineales bacterium]